jgi:hypothetical protein
VFLAPSASLLSVNLLFISVINPLISFSVADLLADPLYFVISVCKVLVIPSTLVIYPFNVSLVYISRSLVGNVSIVVVGLTVVVGFTVVVGTIVVVGVLVVVGAIVVVGVLVVVGAIVVVGVLVVVGVTVVVGVLVVVGAIVVVGVVAAIDLSAIASIIGTVVVGPIEFERGALASAIEFERGALASAIEFERDAAILIIRTIILNSASYKEPRIHRPLPPSPEL